MLRKRKMKTSKILILSIVTVALAAVIGGLLYISFFANKIEPLPLLRLEGGVTIISSLNPFYEIDFLNKSPYVDLKSIGQLPVTVNKMGRKNPFREIIFFPTQP